MLLLSSADLFFLQNYLFKKYFQDYQSVKLSILIWVQTVCIGYPLLSSLARKELNPYCKLAESVHNHIDLYISEINKLTWFIFNSKLSNSSWHVGSQSCKFEEVIVLPSMIIIGCRTSGLYPQFACLDNSLCYVSSQRFSIDFAPIFVIHTC